MKKIIIYILFIIIPSITFSQSVKDTIISGKVSYQTAENVYINFDNTEGIEKDDTLFIKKERKISPVIIVKHISSKSIAGVLIGKNKLANGDEVFAIIQITSEEERLPTEKGIVVVPVEENEIQKPVKVYDSQKIVEPKVSGRINVQSFSNFSNQGTAYNYQRWRYTFKLNAMNIGGSGLSYIQYINFAYRANEWGEISSNLGRAIRIYDLALNYDFSESTTLWFGRHLNRKVSNLSSIDGLQFETMFSNFSLGLIAGSRPNFSDMGFNTKLFQYGVYVNRSDSVGYRVIENTLGYFEQTNDFKTDRRFLYFQHSNSSIKNTRLFLSTEIDLYKKVNGVSKGNFSLTSLFVSANIRPTDALTLYLSYDARKNVIYYETFKSFIDSVLENETRQGFRTRVTIKPIRNLFLGLNYGYRFRSSDLKPSNNYGAYVTYSAIPVIESGITLSFTNLSGTYIKGTIWGARIYKDFNFGMGLSVDYRNTKYQFTQNIEDITQQSISFNINTRLFDPVFVNLTYEGVFQGIRTTGRVLLNLSYRF